MGQRWASLVLAGCLSAAGAGARAQDANSTAPPAPPAAADATNGTAPNAPSDAATPAPAATAAPATAASATAPLVAYVVAAKKPVFNAQNAGTAGFGMVGAILAMSMGDQLVKDNDIPDPAVIVAAEIARVFAAKQGGSAATAPLISNNPFKPTETGGARYLVSVMTSTWGYTYFSFDWTHYRALYGAVMTITDATSHHEVARGHCFVFPPKTADAPSNADMMANSGERLKAMLVADAKVCIADMEAKVPALK